MAAINWFGPVNRDMVLVSEQREGDVTVSEYRCGTMTIRVRENTPSNAAISRAANLIHEIAAKHVSETENPNKAAA